MLNYSKQQYDADRDKLGSKDQSSLDQMYNVWETLSRRCSTSHIINPLPSKILEATNFRKAEKSQADRIKSFILTKSKLKDYSKKHDEDRKMERQNNDE